MVHQFHEVSHPKVMTTNASTHPLKYIPSDGDDHDGDLHHCHHMSSHVYV